MKRNMIIILFLSIMLMVSGAYGDVWDDLAGYEYGDDPNPCTQIETLLQDTPVNQYAEIESKLIAVVASGQATQAGKANACRFLQQVGTDRCITTVAKLLTDEILSDYARLVLERLQVTAADKAMHTALMNAPDVAKIGILGSLAERRYAAATGAAVQLASSANPAVARAAMQALGKIGGSAAADSLLTLKPPAHLVQSQMQALIDCAGTLSGPKAVRLCETVLAGKIEACRIAALRELTRVEPTRASALIAGAIKGTDVQLRRGGLGIVAETTGRKLTLEMLQLLDTLSGFCKAELISALGTRGDKAALSPILKHLSSSETNIRDAAVKAVSKIGDASVVKSLLRTADTPALETSVMQAIVGMQDNGVNAVLIESLKDRTLKRMAIKACVARGCSEATEELLTLTSDDNADIRKEAWSGLGMLADSKDMKSVMGVVVTIQSEQDRSYGDAAVSKIFSRTENRSECFDVLAGFYVWAKGSTKELVLELGVGAGNARALSIERKALASGDEKLYGRALRALAKWPNELAAEDLYRQALDAPENVDRIVALRGYIRIAGLEAANLTVEERMAMIRKSMKLAQRIDEKKQIVSSLQNINNLEALATLEGYMAIPALKVEAQMSAANLIWNLRTLYPSEVTDMAEELIQSDNRTVVSRAQKTLAELEKTKAHILAWKITGPYRENNKGGADLFKTVFPPEQNENTVKWKGLVKGIGQDSINLEVAVGRMDRACVYVKTAVVVPTAQTVRLEMGSDDGIKAWLNGDLVHSNWTTRPCSPGQDVKTVKLRKGVNTLLLKIIDEGGDWAFSCALKQENGRPIKGLRVQP